MLIVQKAIAKATVPSRMTVYYMLLSLAGPWYVWYKSAISFGASNVECPWRLEGTSASVFFITRYCESPVRCSIGATSQLCSTLLSQPNTRFSDYLGDPFIRPLLQHFIFNQFSGMEFSSYSKPSQCMNLNTSSRPRVQFLILSFKNYLF